METIKKYKFHIIAFLILIVVFCISVFVFRQQDSNPPEGTGVNDSIRESQDAAKSVGQQLDKVERGLGEAEQTTNRITERVQQAKDTNSNLTDRNAESKRVSEELGRTIIEIENLIRTLPEENGEPVKDNQDTKKHVGSDSN